MMFEMEELWGHPEAQESEKGCDIGRITWGLFLGAKDHFGRVRHIADGEAARPGSLGKPG